MKVNGRRLEDGWEEFVKDHDLQLGNILIFRHEGDMEFEVAIFDSSCCEREYEQGVHGREEEKVCIVEESSKKSEFKGELLLFCYLFPIWKLIIFLF